MPGSNLSTAPPHHISHKEFIAIIATILAQPASPLANPASCYMEAVAHNWAILESVKLDLRAALHQQQGTPVTFGSKFCHQNALKPLLQYHTLWPWVQHTLVEGMQAPLTKFPEAQQGHIEVWLALQQGNHQSVKQQVAAVQTLLWKEEGSCPWMATPITPAPHLLITRRNSGPPQASLPSHHQCTEQYGPQALPYT